MLLIGAVVYSKEKKGFNNYKEMINNNPMHAVLVFNMTNFFTMQTTHDRELHFGQFFPATLNEKVS